MQYKLLRFRLNTLLPEFPSTTIEELIGDRKNGLTFIRLFLSVLVLLAHAYRLGDFGDDFFFKILTQGQESTGEMAVKSFMLLSGLLVSASVERQTTTLYFIKRSLRIFPGYLCSIFIIAFLFGPIIAALSNVDFLTYFSASENSPWSYFIRNSLLAIRQGGILNLLGTNPVPYYFAGSHWTIWPEFQGYFVIAICGLLGFLKNFRILLLPFSFFYVLSLYSIHHPNSLVFLGDLRKIDLALYLLSGMLLYTLRKQIKINKKGLILSLLLFCLCIFLPLYDWIMPFLLGYLLLFIAHLLPTPLKNFERIGDFSYGIYLYHFTIQQIATLMNLHHLGVIPYVSLTTLFTIPFGILSWYYIEKPANTLSYFFKPKAK